MQTSPDMYYLKLFAPRRWGEQPNSLFLFCVRLWRLSDTLVEFSTSDIVKVEKVSLIYTQQHIFSPTSTDNSYSSQQNVIIICISL